MLLPCQNLFLKRKNKTNIDIICFFVQFETEQTYLDQNLVLTTNKLYTRGKTNDIDFIKYLANRSQLSRKPLVKLAPVSHGSIKVSCIVSLSMNNDYLVPEGIL